MRLSGLVSHRRQEDVHEQREWRVSWGSQPERAAFEAARGGPGEECDRGIDLADKKQMVV